MNTSHYFEFNTLLTFKKMYGAKNPYLLRHERMIPTQFDPTRRIGNIVIIPLQFATVGENIKAMTYEYEYLLWESTALLYAGRASSLYAMYGVEMSEKDAKACLLYLQQIKKPENKMVPYDIFTHFFGRYVTSYTVDTDFQTAMEYLTVVNMVEIPIEKFFLLEVEESIRKDVITHPYVENYLNMMGADPTVESLEKLMEEYYTYLQHEPLWKYLSMLDIYPHHEAYNKIHKTWTLDIIKEEIDLLRQYPTALFDSAEFLKISKQTVAPIVESVPVLVQHECKVIGNDPPQWYINACDIMLHNSSSAQMAVMLAKFFPVKIGRIGFIDLLLSDHGPNDWAVDLQYKIIDTRSNVISHCGSGRLLEFAEADYWYIRDYSSFITRDAVAAIYGKDTIPVENKHFDFLLSIYLLYAFFKAGIEYEDLADDLLADVLSAMEELQFENADDVHTYSIDSTVLDQIRRRKSTLLHAITVPYPRLAYTKRQLAFDDTVDLEYIELSSADGDTALMEKRNFERRTYPLDSLCDITATILLSLFIKTPFDYATICGNIDVTFELASKYEVTIDYREVETPLKNVRFAKSELYMQYCRLKACSNVLRMKVFRALISQEPSYNPAFLIGKRNFIKQGHDDCTQGYKCSECVYKALAIEEASLKSLYDLRDEEEDDDVLNYI
jgi:hypothetical protein